MFVSDTGGGKIPALAGPVQRPSSVYPSDLDMSSLRSADMSKMDMCGEPGAYDSPR